MAGKDGSVIIKLLLIETAYKPAVKKGEEYA
jgi:hypothetical protein